MANRVSSSDSTTVDKAMWEYEAPQYCDFSSADTFVDNDPTVDQFFLTDHDSTKENIGVEDGFNSSGDDITGEKGNGSSDADVFATPLSHGPNSQASGFDSAYKTPKSSVNEVHFDDADVTTPVASNRLSTLRPTTLRDIYNQGGTPLHEPGRRKSVFKSGGGRKSRAAVKSAKKADKLVTVNNNIDNKNDSVRRETFDMNSVSEAIEEISTKEIEVNADKENSQALKVEAKADDLMSEDEDEKNKDHEETVLKVETKKKVEEAIENVNAALADVDFHVISEQELAVPLSSSAVPLADGEEKPSAGNCSRRSSYIVKSPSIRVVHFADESIGSNNSKLGDIAEGELQTTPVTTASSKTSLKIKARHPTPMVAPKTSDEKKAAVPVSKTATVTKIASSNNNKKPLIQGLLRNQLSQKYIKRFSKSMEKEADKCKAEASASTAPLVSAVAKPKAVGISKKRVTIAALPKSSSTSSSTSTTANTTSTSNGKRNLTLKGRRFTTAASILQRKSINKQVTGVTPLKGDETTSRPSPYLGLSVLNNKFMTSYFRNYTPPTAVKMLSHAKPKLTVPRAPNLHTSTRCAMRKVHTVPDLKSEALPKQPLNRKPIGGCRKPTAVSTSVLPKPKTAFVPTKAITPKFSTDARLKLWHVKHASGDQLDGVNNNKKSTTSGGGFLFKARPMPNFKRLQAVAEKQKLSAIEKGKHNLNGNAKSTEN